MAVKALSVSSVCFGTPGKPLIKIPSLLLRIEHSKQGSASLSCLSPLDSHTICRCEKATWLDWLY